MIKEVKDFAKKPVNQERVFKIYVAVVSTMATLALSFFSYIGVHAYQKLERVHVMSITTAEQMGWQSKRLNFVDDQIGRINVNLDRMGQRVSRIEGKIEQN